MIHGRSLSDARDENASATPTTSTGVIKNDPVNRENSSATIPLAIISTGTVTAPVRELYQDRPLITPVAPASAISVGQLPICSSATVGSHRKNARNTRIARRLRS